MHLHPVSLVSILVTVAVASELRSNSPLNDPCNAFTSYDLNDKRLQPGVSSGFPSDFDLMEHLRAISPFSADLGTFDDPLDCPSYRYISIDNIEPSESATVQVDDSTATKETFFKAIEAGFSTSSLTKNLYSSNLDKSTSAPSLITNPNTSALKAASASSEDSEKTPSVDDDDSTSDFEPRKRSKISKNPRNPKSRKIEPKKQSKPVTDPVSSSSASSLPSDVPKRNKFCNRSPFLYRTACNCRRNYFNYIGIAINHMKNTHNYAGNSFNCVIELVDDFGVLHEYPLSCDKCPFATNKACYLDLHQANVHGT